MTTVSILPQEHNISLPSADPARLVGFIEFRRYRRDHWDEASAEIRREGSHNLRVATRVTKSREMV